MVEFRGVLEHQDKDRLAVEALLKAGFCIFDGRDLSERFGDEGGCGFLRGRGWNHRLLFLTTALPVPIPRIKIGPEDNI